MRELYRLREETFRAVGEGTGQPLDTDIYDAYYRQMVLWHVPNQEIVGAYRLGFGPEIMESHGGVTGFYSAALVRYGEKAAPLLAKSMELGRSFITGRYQREIQPLRLLLAGLAVAVLKCPDLTYYSGLVSISDDIPDFYKSLVVRYLEKNFPFPDAPAVATPTTPFSPDFLAVNPDDLLQIPDGKIDLLDRFLGTLSEGKVRLPVLVRKYFSCGGAGHPVPQPGGPGHRVWAIGGNGQGVAGSRGSGPVLHGGGSARVEAGGGGRNLCRTGGGISRVDGRRNGHGQNPEGRIRVRRAGGGRRRIRGRGGSRRGGYGGGRRGGGGSGRGWRG